MLDWFELSKQDWFIDGHLPNWERSWFGVLDKSKLVMLLMSFCDGLRPCMLSIIFYEKTFSVTACSSGAVWTGRWTWALIPYPILSPSLISHTCVCGRKKKVRKLGTRASEFRNCVNREWGGPGLSFPNPFFHTSRISRKERKTSEPQSSGAVWTGSK